MKNGLLLYSGMDYNYNKDFAQRFLDKGKNYGLNIELALEEDIIYGIKGGKFFFGIKNSAKMPDFAINRTRNGFIAQVLENLGARVFNGSAVTFLCNDKNAAYLKAQETGIACLDTYIYAKESINKVLINYPAVIKKPFSHGGKQVYLCKNDGELDNALNLIEGRFITVQSRLCGTVSDIRVFVMGNSIIGAVKRTAKGGFKANMCQGGDISLFEPGNVIRDYVNRLFNTGYYDFAGFDFLTDGGNYYFNEIEDAVGSRSLCILAGIDTADLYLKHIAEKLSGV